MTDAEKILDRAKKALGLKTDTELADHFGIGKTTLSSWRTRNSINYNALFTKCGQVNLHWLLTGEGPMMVRDIGGKNAVESEAVLEAEARKIQLLLDRGLIKFREPQLLAIPKEHFIEEEHGNIEVPHYQHRVAAGLPADSTSPAETITLPKMLVKHPKETYTVAACGDSMTGAGIEEGDILIVDTAIEPQHKNIVIASLDGEQTVKRLWIEGKNIKLMPENSHYKPIEITKSMRFDPQGVVVWVIRKTV